MDRASLVVPLLCLALAAAVRAEGPGSSAKDQAGAGTAPVAGRFMGRYVCNQGVTGLTLEIRVTGPASWDPGRDRDACGPLTPDPSFPLEATFSFYQDPENPGVPAGRFGMRGLYFPTSRSLELVGGAWQLQPAGYVTVDLTGRLDEDGLHLAGTVGGPGCEGFTLERVVPESGSWMGDAASEAPVLPEAP